MVITKVKIGISSRREGVEIRGDTVDLGGLTIPYFLTWLVVAKVFVSKFICQIICFMHF